VSTNLPEVEVLFDPKLIDLLIAATGGEIRTELINLTMRAARVAEAEMKKQIIMLLAGKTTGELHRSVRPDLVKQSGDEIVVIVGPHKIYARIQDQGGVVYPKKKYLAIPLPFANVRKGKWPRDWGPDDLVFINRDKKGKDPLLALKTGKGRIEPKYALKRSATLKGVHYVDATAKASEEEMRQIVSEGLDALVQRVLAQGVSSPA
jgi:hypothetical protein